MIFQSLYYYYIVLRCLSFSGEFLKMCHDDVCTKRACEGDRIFDEVSTGRRCSFRSVRSLQRRPTDARTRKFRKPRSTTRQTVFAELRTSMYCALLDGSAPLRLRQPQSNILPPVHPFTFTVQHSFTW